VNKDSPIAHKNQPVVAPYVPDSRPVPEFTVRALILGALLGIVFGAANAYLGLKVGMTVSASIPAAVMSMAILRGILRRGNVLENNIVQTIASTGESLAAGVVFTIPALLILGVRPSLATVFVVSLLGGCLGVLFMIPLRQLLIVQEHRNLPYPEGTACARVITAGDEGGSKAKQVFVGLGLGAVYKFLMSGLGLWKEEPTATLTGFHKATVGAIVSPVLLGVGMIIGPRIAMVMFAGGALGWLVLIPLIDIVGSALSAPLPPATVPISQMSAESIWSDYVRYIGAGAVALGGAVSLLKTLPVILRSFRMSSRAFTRLRGQIMARRRTERDLPMSVLVVGSFVIAIAVLAVPGVPANVATVLMVLLFSFFFVAVASRIVGIVGSSSSPVSGMTLATMLVVAVIYSSLEITGTTGMIATLLVGAVVCIALCVAGDISQDLKTGFLVGATPYKQQLAEFVGVLIPALVIGPIVYLLLSAYPIRAMVTPEFAAANETLLAPQATIMSMVTEGVFSGNLPWTLLVVGAAIAAVVEIVGIPSLPFAIGLYLPISLSSPILFGGLLARTLRADSGDSGAAGPAVLMSSGLVAGDTLVGILLAFLVYAEVSDSIDLGRLASGATGEVLSVAMFVVLAASAAAAIVRWSRRNVDVLT
jgi:putative OPT family oligopeptide transporter